MTNFEIGARVKVVRLCLKNRPEVSQYLKKFIGKTGEIKTNHNISGSFWVEFKNKKGAIFYPTELEANPNERFE